MDLYLDQNHWIYLSRAYHGRSQRSDHGEIATRLLARVEQGEWRVPIAFSHLVEYHKEQDGNRRARLAVTFEVFSRGWYLADWTDIVLQELRRAVAAVFGTLLIFPRPEMIGLGFMFAMGEKARAAIPSHWSNTDVLRLDKYSKRPGALFDLLTFPNEENRLKQRIAAGQRGRNTAEGAEKMRQVRRSASRSLWRRAQAAENTLQHQDDLLRALADNGKTMEDFVDLGPERMTAFWTHVPSIDTQMELEFYRDRQWTRAVSRNDLGDLSHLVLAIPYSDVVVTEKLWTRAAQETRLARKYETAVFNDLAALADVLA